jgi:transposase
MVGNEERARAVQAVGAPMLESEEVRLMRELHAQGWGAKRIARELKIARNTVRRYLRGAGAGVQVRPAARALDDAQRAEATRLFEGTAEGNAVVVTELLAGCGADASLRTVQRVVQPTRAAQRATQLATVRFETPPGDQMQIDFGQKLVRIAGAFVRVHLLVAVLSYSRRLCVKAFLSERRDDWLEGIATAFRRFEGVPRTLLGDNPKALVIARDVATQAVTFAPAYLAFCRDWDVVPRACAPYRARTKGKTEAGVKYAKHNALAGREFTHFAALEDHLGEWLDRADQRVHGTTHERPLDRFLRDEQAALRPLPARPLPVRAQRLRRRVASDALVNVETVRYSVPHRLVHTDVEVHVGDHVVQIFAGAALVATHARSREPHAVVRDPAHYAGLWRPTDAPPAAARRPAAAGGRDLQAYADAIAAGAEAAS